MHYQRWKKYGDPEQVAFIRGDRPARFESKVDRSGDGCHEWTGGRDDDGYGIFMVKQGGKGKRLRAHVVAWEAEVGPVPTGLQVCHHCDNPPCVRVDHLFLGTTKENSEDRDRKGRQARGSNNAGAVLSEDDVRRIRSLYQPRVVTAVALSEMFNVSEVTIRRIVSPSRSYWRHVA